MEKIVRRTALLLLCVMMVGQLPAQNRQKNKAKNESTAEVVADTLTDALQAENVRLMNVNDSLQKVVDSLTLRLQTTQIQSDKDRQAASRIQGENDSLKKLVEAQYLFIYRGARALLYRPYHSFYDEYIDFLSMVPDSLIQAHTYGMWAEVKNMIMNSKEDSLVLREEVWGMVKDLPSDVLQNKDKQVMRKVLQKVADNPQYSMVQHALSILKAIPLNNIGKEQQQNFTALINVLSAYKQYNDEVKKALNDLKEQSVTTLDYNALENVLNKTQYYRQKEVRIYYLDDVMKEAKRLIRDARLENRRVNQAELQKLIDTL